MNILDPTNQDDNAAFSGIRDLAHIASDNAAIDANPLFQFSENFIVDLLPDVKLQSTPVAGKGRTYPRRGSIISALQFLTASNFLRAGGSVGSSDSDTTVERTGTLRSETEQIGPVSRTKNYSTSESSTQTHRVQTDLPHETRAEWLEKQAHAILEQLGAVIQISDVDVCAFLTDSRLDDISEAEEESVTVGDLSYIRR